MDQIGDEIGAKRRQQRDDKLLSIGLLHALVGAALAPMSYGADFLIGNRQPELFGGVAFCIAVAGALAGVGLGQIWLIAMWGAFGRQFWAARLGVVFAAVLLLYGCWSIVHVAAMLVLDRHWLGQNVGITLPLTLDQAVFLASAYGLTAGFIGWLVRLAAHARLALDDGSHEPAHWQFGIGHLLAATLLVGIMLTLGGCVLKFAYLLVEYAAVGAMSAAHTMLSMPLMLRMAYRAAAPASAAERLYVPLLWFLISCALETAILVLFASIIGDVRGIEWELIIAVLAILVLTTTAAQLLVIVSTVRALRAAGGRLLR